MCFKPLEVTASGNSARPFFLERVTFFTSIKVFLFSLVTKKSNLVFSPNLTSCLMSFKFEKFLINPFFKASKTILLVMLVFIPIFDFLSSIICKVYLSFLFGLSDLLSQTLLPLNR